MKTLEKEILRILNEKFLSDPKYIQNNIYVFNKWESDYFALTKSMNSYEIEVKTSKSDFSNDFAKTEKHDLLSGKVPKYDTSNTGALGPVPLVPNYFFYACVDGVIDVKDVPSYAGLIYVKIDTASIKVIKKAPILSPMKFDSSYYRLDEKFYGRLISVQKRLNEELSGDSTKKQVSCAVEAVRRSAEQAFWSSCPFRSGESEFPMCVNPECLKGNQHSCDCLLQCDRGRIFKKVLR